MKNSLRLFSNTVKGGLFFLFPLVLTLLFLEKGIKIFTPVANAIGEKLGIESSLFNVPYLIAFGLLLLLCFGAGFVASFGLGKWLVSWIENNVLVLFPGYQLLKNTMQQSAGLDAAVNFPVVLVPIDGWMLAYVVDELESGELVTFVPAAPGAMEGNVVIFEKEKVKYTTLQSAEVKQIMRSLGVNSASHFKGKSKFANIKKSD